jgi:hypothetical protein
MFKNLNDRARVCSDCLYVSANGADENTTEWLGFLPEYADVIDLSPVDPEDEGHFSWSPCRTCGDVLGGTRFDVVVTIRSEHHPL